MLKKIAVTLLSIFFVAGCATMQNDVVPAGVEELRLFGMIIDNACAAQHRDNILEFSKTYSREQALNCTLGYAFYTIAEIREFDTASNARIDQYLQKNDSKVKVGIKCYRINNKLHLIEILPTEIPDNPTR